MDWAVAIEGRNDPQSVLLLFAERSEAVAVAQEMHRRNRLSICVRPFYRRQHQSADNFGTLTSHTDPEARSPSL
jgi:hypothetical protein